MRVKQFIADIIVLDISPDVIVHDAALRKDKKNTTSDAIIAATALAYGYIHKTANEKRFCQY